MQFQLTRNPKHYLFIAVTNHSNSKKVSGTRVLRLKVFAQKRDSRQQFSGTDSVNEFRPLCSLYQWLWRESEEPLEWLHRKHLWRNNFAKFLLISHTEELFRLCLCNRWDYIHVKYTYRENYQMGYNWLTCLWKTF